MYERVLPVVICNEIATGNFDSINRTVLYTIFLSIHNIIKKNMIWFMSYKNYLNK